MHQEITYWAQSASATGEMLLIGIGWMLPRHTTQTLSKFIAGQHTSSLLMASGKIGHRSEFCIILGRFASFLQLNASPVDGSSLQKPT